jgi:hypothetical protein
MLSSGSGQLSLAHDRGEARRQISGAIQVCFYGCLGVVYILEEACLEA